MKRGILINFTCAILVVFILFFFYFLGNGEIPRYRLEGQFW